VRRLLTPLLLFTLGLPAAHALSPGETLEDFTLPTRSGPPFQLDALRGKVVYLDFWASWCAPCRHSFPFMQRLQRRYADQGLAVVAVNLDQEPALMERFLAEYPSHFPIPLDPQGEEAERLGLKVMPTSYLIDRQGRLRQVHQGFRDDEAEGIEHALQQLLEE